MLLIIKTDVLREVNPVRVWLLIIKTSILREVNPARV